MVWFLFLAPILLDAIIVFLLLRLRRKMGKKMRKLSNEMDSFLKEIGKNHSTFGE